MNRTLKLYMPLRLCNAVELNFFQVLLLSESCFITASKFRVRHQFGDRVSHHDKEWTAWFPSQTSAMPGHKDIIQEDLIRMST
jgi:hypothetical protein